MVQKWQTVRVFISSTFRDMDAERDYLVRIVFPELKERCRKRHVQLIDVDLRWGVTERQAEGGGALDICLDEIDSCRPFFLGLLGHRYGYTPPGQEHSITAQEIYHGVLHNYLPRQVVDLRPIVEGILEGRTLLKEQVSCLVRCYQWDANKSKYLLQEDIPPEDKEMLHSIFTGYSIYQRDRSFFFFRSESLTEELRERSESKAEDYFDTEKAAKDKLGTLKQDIIDAELAHYKYGDIETFGQMVLDTLWKHIDADFPEERALEERDWLQEEAEFHELFMAERTRRFVGRSDLLSDMHAFAEKDSDPCTLVITGEPGCGKSALMARFTEEVSKNHPDWLIIPHFVGASPSSTSLRSTLRRFCTHLNRALGVAEEVPKDYKELARLFPELLEKASKDHRVLLIIDAINQFEKTDNPQSMTWIPQALPKNMRVVVSTLVGETLDTLKAWRIQPRFEKVSGLTEPEIKELVTKYLGELRKEFPTKDISKAFYGKIKAGHPLYILVALEELRVFPIYEKLGERVAELPDSVPELFDQVLKRIEGDFSQPLVRDFTSFIACGRQGMTAQELQTLLKAHALVVDPASPPQKLPDMLLAKLRRALSAYLFERSGVIDFFHGQLKEAVGRRYLPEEADREKTHQILAGYFEQRWAEPYLRAIDELPHQFTKAKDWEGVERVLCDLHFIEAKCADGMTYDLVADYNTALDALPEAQEERQKEREHEERIKKYTEDLIAFAKGEIKHLDIIPSVEPLSEERIKEDSERIISNPTRLDRVLAFSQFVNSESHGLGKFGTMPGFCLQQAHNSVSSGPVASAAEEIINTRVEDFLLLEPPYQRPAYNPHPALLRTLEGHTNDVNSVSITPDGKRAVSGGGEEDKTLKVWNLESGKCLKTLEGHSKDVDSVSITSDGNRAVSGSLDDTLRVWDLESGECLKTLEGHPNYVNSVSITPDGKRAVSGSAGAISGSGDDTLRVWDLESGECLKTLKGDKNFVWSVSITPDGKRAISGGGDETLRVWDLESGKCLKTLEGHTNDVTSVSITPDGKRAVSGSDDETLRVWDLESGKCLKTLEGYESSVDSVSITPDGKKAVSGGGDETLRVWDLESGKCLKTLEGHTNDVTSVSITPDGKRAVSSSKDNTLRVWDPERGKCLRALERHERGVNIVSITPDGKRAVSRSGYEALCILDPESGKCLRTLKGHESPVRSVSITPDGKRAVSGSGGYESKDNTLRVWDLESGKCLGILEGHTQEVLSVSITPDGKRAVSSSEDNTLRVWDLESEKCLRTLKGPKEPVDGQKSPESSSDTFSSPEQTTASLFDFSWLGQTINSIAASRTYERIYCVRVTPDGKRVVSGCGDKTLWVWDLETGECLMTLEGHKDLVVSVSITPDGKRAVSGSEDDTLRVWDLVSGKCLMTLKGHESSVKSVRVTPDGKRAVSGSSDKTLRVWNLDSGECFAAYQARSAVRSISEIIASGLLALATHEEVIFLRPRNLPMDTPIITPVRNWLYREKGNKGQWNDNITTVCQWCGQRFPVADEILNVITAIARNANLSPDQSPCLELPAEAWEEPRLLSKCPHCHQPLKFNPFLVDNRR